MKADPLIWYRRLRFVLEQILEVVRARKSHSSSIVVTDEPKLSGRRVSNSDTLCSSKGIKTIFT